MATQDENKKQGDGGGKQQALTRQQGGERQGGERSLARGTIPTARRLMQSPFSMMRRMLDDLDTSSWASPFTSSSPFTMMRRMFDDMERMLGTDLDWGAREYVWTPPVEVTQRDDKLLVRVDLPGIPQDQIQVTTEGTSLVIEGERTMSGAERENVWSSERVHGRFRRVVALPEGIDADKAEARYENGVLEVSLPLPDTMARARRIQIQSSTRGDGSQKRELEQGATPQQPQRR